LALSLFGCGSEEPEAPPAEVVRPVKTIVVAAPESGGIRHFPARIDANRKAELSFRVSGKVSELAIKEGDRVEEGQLIARLDPTDYQITVNDRQAAFDNAKKNFERAKKLVKKGHISKMDHDRLEAEFKSTRAALNEANQNLSYTELHAPFDGMIAQRYIQAFEEVQAKQPAVALNDVSTLEVKFDVPESIIRGIRTARADEPQSERAVHIPVYAEFEGMPERRFPLRFKEAATRGDSKTQTFEVTYTMERPDGVALLAGMTANVTVDLSHFLQVGTVVNIPAAAVVGDVALQPKVWVVDANTLTVTPKAVKVGAMAEDDIEVLDGLSPGERIVVAGAPYLVDGMKVTLMPTIEQAEPRKNEPR
jgi:RND family efflux transporter MFP subunit